MRSKEEFNEAITAWEESIKLQPSSPDAHTSMFKAKVPLPENYGPDVLTCTDLASAYIISDKSRPDLALHHLR